jgi:hypothetical protein
MTDPLPERAQLGGLGLFTLDERRLRRVVARSRPRPEFGVRRQAGLNLDQVPLPPARPLHRRRRRRLE